MCVYNAMYSMVPLPLSSLPRLAAISGEGAEQSRASRGVQTVAHGRVPPQVPLGPPPVQSQDHVRGSTWNQTQYPENVQLLESGLCGAGSLGGPVSGPVCPGLVPCSGAGASHAHPTGWSKFYEFSLSDLRAGASIIDRLCAKPGLNMILLIIYHMHLSEQTNPQPIMYSISL